MSSNLLGDLQEIIQANLEALKPTDLAFGTVTKAAPIEILVDGTSQPKPQAGLILTDAVVARTAKVQGGSGGTVTINPGLTVGDKVVMLRVQRGQRYIVLSKVY